MDGKYIYIKLPEGEFVVKGIKSSGYFLDYSFKTTKVFIKRTWK